MKEIYTKVEEFTIIIILYTQTYILVISLDPFPFRITFFRFHLIKQFLSN